MANNSPDDKKPAQTVTPGGTEATPNTPGAVAGTAASAAAASAEDVAQDPSQPLTPSAIFKTLAAALNIGAQFDRRTKANESARKLANKASQDAKKKEKKAIADAGATAALSKLVSDVNDFRRYLDTPLPVNPYANWSPSTLVRTETVDGQQVSLGPVVAGARPIRPLTLIPYTTKPDELPMLPAGFYITYGTTGGGKSLTMAALACYMASKFRNFPSQNDVNSVGFTPEMQVELDAAMNGASPPFKPILPAYLYVYEARSPRGFLNLETAPVLVAEQVAGARFFVDRLAFALGLPGDFDALTTVTGVTETANGQRKTIEAGLSAALNASLSSGKVDLWGAHGLTQWYERRKQNVKDKNNAVDMLVIDSVTLPLRAFCAVKGPEGRKGEPTMPGGLQPSDIAFCERMQAMATMSNLAIIGIVNADLVPFADKLEGVCEGAFSITGPGAFRLRTRRTRSFETFNLPEEWLNFAAREVLAYEQSTKRPDFEGIKGLLWTK